MQDLVQIALAGVLQADTTLNTFVGSQFLAEGDGGPDQTLPPFVMFEYVGENRQSSHMLVQSWVVWLYDATNRGYYQIEGQLRRVRTLLDKQTLSLDASGDHYCLNQGVVYHSDLRGWDRYFKLPRVGASFDVHLFPKDAFV